MGYHEQGQKINEKLKVVLTRTVGGRTEDVDELVNLILWFG